MNNTKSIFKKSYLALLTLLVLVTPLLFTTKTYEAFEFPKMIFVYFIGSTLIWLFLIKKIWFKEKIVLPDRWVLIFLGIYIISTAFSMHLNTSVFGYYTRFNGGLLSVSIFIGLYILLINEFNKNGINKIIKLSCLPLVPIAIFGIIQYLDDIERVYSTLGQPNWLAAFIVILLPITLYQIFENKFIKKLQWGVIFLIGFFSLWVTFSISGFLAFVVSLVAFIYLNWEKIKQNKIWLSTLFGLSLMIAVLNPGIFTQKVQDIKIDVQKIYQNNFTAIAQQEELENVISDPGYIRLHLWKGSINLAGNSFKNFVIGTGPETFPYAFQDFRPSALNYSSEWDVVFNKPHNYYIELLTNVGILGLGAYILIIKDFFTSKNKFLVPSILALLITNFFGWPSVAVSLLFWIMLAQNYLLKKEES